VQCSDHTSPVTVVLLTAELVQCSDHTSPVTVGHRARNVPQMTKSTFTHTLKLKKKQPIKQRGKAKSIKSLNTILFTLIIFHHNTASLHPCDGLGHNPASASSQLRLNFCNSLFIVFLLVTCSITHFRNPVSGCNYPGSRTRFQLLSKEKRQCNDMSISNYHIYFYKLMFFSY